MSNGKLEINGIGHLNASEPVITIEKGTNIILKLNNVKFDSKKEFLFINENANVTLELEGKNIIKANRLRKNYPAISIGKNATLTIKNAVDSNEEINSLSCSMTLGAVIEYAPGSQLIIESGVIDIRSAYSPAIKSNINEDDSHSIIINGGNITVKSNVRAGIERFLDVSTSTFINGIVRIKEKEFIARGILCQNFNINMDEILIIEKEKEFIIPDDKSAVLNNKGHIIVQGKLSGSKNITGNGTIILEEGGSVDYYPD